MSRPRSEIAPVPADPSEPHHGGVLFVKGVPVTTKAAFKAAVSYRGSNMRDVLIRFMRVYARKNLPQMPAETPAK